MPSVVLITMNYAPEVTGIARNTVDMAHRLRDAGHRVTVITAMPHFPAWSVDDAYRGHIRCAESLDGIDVRRFNLFVPTHQSLITRASYEVTWLINAASIGPIRGDLFVGIVPPLVGGWLARYYAAWCHARFAVVFADLMAKAAEQSGIPGAALSKKIVRSLEIGAAKAASRVGIISDGFRDYLVNNGVDPTKIHRIVNRNGATTIRPQQPRTSVRMQRGWRDDEFVILHSGNMGYKQALENVLAAANLANRNRRLKFVLLGDGNQRRHLQNRAREMQLSNVEFLPIVPTQDFDAVLAAADALLVNQRGSVTDMSLPGKLTGYFAAGIPVVAAVARQSETARELERSGAGLLVAPDAPEALFNGIEALSRDRLIYERLAKAGPKYVRKYLDTANTSDIVRLVELCLASEATSGP